MPRKPKKQPPAATPKTEPTAKPVSGAAKSVVAERVESQVGAQLGDGGAGAPPADPRYWFQKVLPMGYGGRESPVPGPTGATPARSEPVVEETDGVESEGDEDDAEEDAGEKPKAPTPTPEAPVERSALALKKARAKANAKKREEEAAAALAAAHAEQAIRLKAAALESLAELKASEDWTQRTARITTIHAVKKDQDALALTVSATAFEALKSAATAATSHDDISAVIKKIEAFDLALKSLGRKVNFDVALKALEAHPPLPLTKVVADPVDGDDHAKPTISDQRATHILDGDGTGGKHAGGHHANLDASAPKSASATAAAKHPDTNSFSAALHKSYFPAAWTNEDILDAVKEAAAQTFDSRVAQPKTKPSDKLRYKHAGYLVTLRRIPVTVVVITEDTATGYQVITGHPA